MRQLATCGAALLLLAAACAPGQVPSASVSPTAGGAFTPGPSTPAASPSRTATPPAATTPSPQPPAVGLAAQCRLPVYWWDLGVPAERHRGFATFPGGGLMEDASVRLHQDSGPVFFDRAVSRWITAVRDQVSPDGRQYAYAEGNPLSAAQVPGKLHVVNIATGADRVIYNSAVVPTVVQFTTDGIYFTHDFGEGEQDGLWFISPEGGQPRLISSTIWEPAVANGAAWGLAFNAADPHPASGGITHPYNTILRVDLKTGTSVVWWYQPGKDIRILDGDYSGHLFAYTFREGADGSLTDWILDSRGTAHPIGSANLGYMAAIDANGVWFDDQQSPTLWLFSNGALKRIANFNVLAIGVAGGCIPGA